VWKNHKAEATNAKEKPKDRNKKKPSGKEENNVIAAAWL